MNIVLSTYLCILILYNDVPYLYIVILVDSLHMWVQTGAAAIRCAHPSLKDPHSYALMSIISNYIPLISIYVYIHIYICIYNYIYIQLKPLKKQKKQQKKTSKNLNKNPSHLYPLPSRCHYHPITHRLFISINPQIQCPSLKHSH